MNKIDIRVLKGLVLSKITCLEDEIYFHSVCGKKFKMYHEKDCCECVYIEDICGDMNNLIDSPILISEERQSDLLEPLSTYDDSFTLTFYEIATLKGSVTIRWYGSSNGYYSERVDFEELDPKYKIPEGVSE